MISVAWGPFGHQSLSGCLTRLCHVVHRVYEQVCVSSGLLGGYNQNIMSHMLFWQMGSLCTKFAYHERALLSMVVWPLEDLLIHFISWEVSTVQTSRCLEHIVDCHLPCDVNAVIRSSSSIGETCSGVEGKFTKFLNWRNMYLIVLLAEIHKTVDFIFILWILFCGFLLVVIY